MPFAPNGKRSSLGSMRGDSWGRMAAAAIACGFMGFGAGACDGGGNPVGSRFALTWKLVYDGEPTTCDLPGGVWVVVDVTTGGSFVDQAVHPCGDGFGTSGELQPGVYGLRVRMIDAEQHLVAPDVVMTGTIASGGVLVLVEPVVWDLTPAGARYHVAWELLFEGVPATCEDAGVVSMRLDSYDVEAETVETLFPCAGGEGETGWIQARFLMLNALDAAGRAIASSEFPLRGPDGGDPRHVDLGRDTLRVFDEPVPQLQRIFDGAKNYYLTHGEDPPIFPPSLPATPGLFACCAAPGKICPDFTELWTEYEPRWAENLGFVLEGPHRCSYAFESVGEGLGASFVARAFCNADCDLILAVYELHGWLDGTAVVGDEDPTVYDWEYTP